MPGDAVSGASSATAWWIDGLNWLCAIGFAFATLYWIARSVGVRREPSRRGSVCCARRPWQQAWRSCSP